LDDFAKFKGELRAVVLLSVDEGGDVDVAENDAGFGNEATVRKEGEAVVWDEKEVDGLGKEATEGIDEYDLDPDLSELFSLNSFKDEMVGVFVDDEVRSKTLLEDLDEKNGSGLALKFLSIFFLDSPGDSGLVSKTVVELFEIWYFGGEALSTFTGW